MKHVTRAAFLADPSVKTPVFVRFSTVAGGAGLADLVRDVRGFAVKFYTSEGNFDLVGNNIPVFFVQDAMKFPDLVHAVKMEPDRAFPQAASAHDTFWDFISLMPEAMHMIMWVMSDRAIPRSYRMMEGFGVHTFKLVDAAGASRFVKFHWRPKLGTAAVLWDEAVKINGADPDFHRRDLWEAIHRGDFPEFELGLQVFDQAQADRFPFDVLDATKLIPEELLPVEIIGKMVLNRNPDNFFAETEQVAFCASDIVPGIDFSDDPLLQGRLFSYLDTQLSRLGGPNFHQIPVNRPQCPFQNMQRDGHMQMTIPKGRVNYEPSELDTEGPRESARGFSSHPAAMVGEKARIRPESFADHYTQARLFYRSVTEQEQHHIAAALGFELAKVETLSVRRKMLGHLELVDPRLRGEVAGILGMTEAEFISIEPARPPLDMDPSPALRLYGKYPPTLAGRKVGVLLGDGFDPGLFAALAKAVADAGAVCVAIALKVAGAKDAIGKLHPADTSLAGTPSCLLDAVVLLCGAEGEAALSNDADARQFVTDARRHL